MYFVQLFVWLVIVTISKMTVFALEYTYADEMITFGIATLSVFDGHPNIELIFVMMIVPFTLNSFQYWVQDSFLAGTEFIQDQKKNAENEKKEM